MARNERSSARLASKAAKALLDPDASKREKSLAGSVLTQAPDKKGASHDKKKGKGKDKGKNKGKGKSKGKSKR